MTLDEILVRRGLITDELSEIHLPYVHEGNKLVWRGDSDYALIRHNKHFDRVMREMDLEIIAEGNCNSCLVKRKKKEHRTICWRCKKPIDAWSDWYKFSKSKPGDCGPCSIEIYEQAAIDRKRKAPDVM